MFALSEEHKLVQQMVRRWVEAKLAPQNDALESGELLPYDLMRDFAKTFDLAGMVKAGFAKMAEKSQSDQPGSADLSTLGGGDPGLTAAIAIEMSRMNPGFYLAFGATLGLAGGAIMNKGTLAQKKRWALPILTLEKIGCWAMTEPGAGSDAFGSMRTSAKKDGDNWVLSGQKTFITNAPFADICVVYAKIDPAAGGSARGPAEPGRDASAKIDNATGTPMRERPFHAFIVEKGTPGLSQGKPMRKMGMHTSPTGELFLDEVRVPAENLLGEANETARTKARNVFHGERTGMAPMCLGMVNRCLEVAVPYAKERKTWERPIAEYQLIQEKLARMFMHRQNIENLLYKQIWMQKNHLHMNEAEASATKLYCARATTEVALEAIQILGGNGYMQEYHVEQIMRDAKLLQIGGGTDEIQITNIARFLLRE